MQLKFFTIPVNDSATAEKELNNFLSSHKVLEVITSFNPSPNGGSWHVCAKFIGGSDFTGKNSNSKVDYKEVLSEAAFAVFSKLRAIRKQIATDEAIPAYAVFTDEELASMARAPEITKKSLLSIEGVGEKKVEKYGTRLIEMLNNPANDQADRKPDAPSS